MDAEEIIKNLQSTAYKFTYANQARAEARKLDANDRFLLKIELQRYMRRPEYTNLVKSINQIIS